MTTVTASWTSTSSPDELRAALEAAHVPTLVAAMATLSGDDSWLRESWRPPSQRDVEKDSGGLPDDVVAEIRDHAFDLVMAWRAGEVPTVALPGPDELHRMLEITFGSGAQLPDGMGELLAEELGAGSRFPEPGVRPGAERLRVLIVGAGLAGVCAAIQLNQLGIPFLILEKNDGIGGTWYENTYPGCGVDTPSHLYSYSFAQRPTWSRFFAPRGELYTYLNELADEYDLHPYLRCGREVTEARWDEERQLWSVDTVNGAGEREHFEAEVVIAGTGYLNRPKLPDITGLERFTGTCMHTARWQPDADVTGKRVAIIGTGATAMQIVPSIAEAAQRVTIFQRTPQWGLPNANQPRAVPDGVRLLMHEVPWYLQWYRLRMLWTFGDRLYPALQIDPEWPHQERSISKLNDRHREFLTKHILSELGDRAEELAPVCVPDYPPFGKRPLLDHGWFRTVRRDDVELITDGIREITENAVVTESGREIEADVLLVATGFQPLNLVSPIELYGRSGRSLRETWGPEDAQAHLGIAVADFPNFFTLLGPNSLAGHGGSAAMSIEMEVGYITKLLVRMLADGITSVAPLQSVQDDYVKRVDDKLSRTVWAHRGFDTYYRNSAGRVVTIMPWTNVDFRAMVHEPDLTEFHVRRGPDSPVRET